MMERLMIFFTFSFFLFHNLIQLSNETYQYELVVYLFMILVTACSIHLEKTKLNYRLNAAKLINTAFIGLLFNLFFILLTTNFGFTFFDRVDFNNQNFLVLFYSLTATITYFILIPSAIAWVHHHSIHFLMELSEGLVKDKLKKISYQTFERAKKTYAPNLLFNSTGPLIPVFEPHHMYLYGSNQVMKTFPNRKITVAKHKKLDHYDQILKNLTKIYNPFTLEEQSVIMKHSNELLDVYFNRLYEDYCKIIPLNGPIHPRVTQQIQIIQEKQSEFLEYIKLRYKQIKEDYDRLVLDVLAVEEYQRSLKNIDDSFDFGDCYLKAIHYSEQPHQYPLRLLLTKKGFYLIYLANTSSNNREGRLMVDGNQELCYCEYSDEGEKVLVFDRLKEMILQKVEVFNFHIHQHTDVLNQNRLTLQPLILTAKNNEVFGELDEIKIMSIKDFEALQQTQADVLAETDYKDLIELVEGLVTCQVVEEMNDYEYELSHNIRSFGIYMKQIHNLLNGFEGEQTHISNQFKNK